MSLWKKTMDYLGLGADDAYEGGGYDDGGAVDERSPRASRGPEQRRPRGYAEEPSGDVRTVPARPSYPSPDGRGRGGVIGDPAVSVRNEQRSAPAPPPGRSPYPAPSHNTEPHTVRPRRFDEAQEVADKFKDGLPVIMNLESTERDVARRLIDFASGICYALDGSMEKVATGVYLLKPPAIRPRQDTYYE